jgi:hypothetical protein
MALIRDATIDTWRSAYAGIVPVERLAGLSYERSAERLRLGPWTLDAGFAPAVRRRRR